MAATAEVAQLRPAFSLDMVVRETITATDDTDIYALSEVVLTRIPTRQRTHVLRELIADRIRQLDHGQRQRATRMVPADETATGDAPASGRWESARLSIAERAERLRLMPVGGRERALFGSYTAVEVQSLIDMHVQLAETNASRAAQYQRVLDAMAAAKAVTVGELGDEDLVSAFTD